MRWRWSPEVAQIGEQLIRDVDDHAPLQGVHIYWLFMDDVPKSSGRLVLGRARRVSGWAAFLAQGPVEAATYETPVPFYAIEIAEPIWLQLKPHQKRALVDHELCHLRVDLTSDPPALKVQGHDFEEFTAVIRRNGLWSTASSTAAMALAEELANAVDGVTSFVESIAPDKAGPPPGVDPDTGEIGGGDD